VRFDEVIIVRWYSGALVYNSTTGEPELPEGVTEWTGVVEVWAALQHSGRTSFTSGNSLFVSDNWNATVRAGTLPAAVETALNRGFGFGGGIDGVAVEVRGRLYAVTGDVQSDARRRERTLNLGRTIA